MIPLSLLGSGPHGAEVVPSYLTAADYPWLRALLDEYERFAGLRRRELDQRLSEPLPVACPVDRLKMTRLVLDKLWRDRTKAAVSPRLARAELFGAAARRGSREQAIAEACDHLGIGKDELLEALFADLPGQRRLVPPSEPLSVAELAVRSNLELVAGLLRRSVEVRIRALGNVRALVRQAKLRGLLCAVQADVTTGPSRLPPGAELHLSGPLALFRRTLVYGRALASLVPRLAWCDRFERRCSFLERCLIDEDMTERRCAGRSLAQRNVQLRPDVLELVEQYDRLGMASGVTGPPGPRSSASSAT